jgi:hypothetical protein
MSKCNLLAVAGVAIVGFSEFEEFLQPSAARCLDGPMVTDFGPPEGCNGGSLPHSRYITITSLSNSTSVTAGMSLQTGYTVFDPDHVPSTDQAFPFAPFVRL